MTVYILEFGQVIGSPTNPKGKAKFYVGWCKDGEVERRLQEHRNGAGAKITRYCANEGITITLIAVLPGTRKTERQIKNRKNTPRLVEQLRRKGLLLKGAAS